MQANNVKTAPATSAADVTFHVVDGQSRDGIATAEACDQECKMFMLSACVKIFGFALNAVWFGFAVAALARESNASIVDECHDSVLWPCLCTCCVLSGISILESLARFRRSKAENAEDDLLGALCSVVVAVGVAIWGAVELSRPCAVNELDTHAVYLMLLIWVISTAVGVTTIILVSFYFCYACATEEKLDRTDRPTQLAQTIVDIEGGM